MKGNEAIRKVDHFLNMGVLPSCSHVSTTVWSHHVESSMEKKLDGNYTSILYAVLN